MLRRLALFVDRREAGRRLAPALERFRPRDPLVIALPRGGVPVAYEIAQALSAPLDILLARKIGAPHHPEYGIGAIAEGGVQFIRREEVELTGTTEEELASVVAAETGELERRQHLYRGEREPLPVDGRAVILVDDGVATGGTAIVAAQALRARGAASVVLAVPVAPPGASRRLAGDFDEVVCLEEPNGFFGVGQFYVDFGQVSDEEVRKLLATDQEPPQAGLAADPLADDPPPVESAVAIEPAPGMALAGDLRIPDAAAGLVVFAHGSGSSRHSPRNRQVAEALNEAGFATLLFDLLTTEEERERANVFDIGLLAQRLLAVTRWAQEEETLKDLPISYFGASTGAAAALRGADWQVLALNEEAAALLRCEHEVAIVPGATHLFEEPGALERVAELAAAWFSRYSP